jgi:hypothetical protein
MGAKIKVYSDLSCTKEISVFADNTLPSRIAFQLSSKFYIKNVGTHKAYKINTTVDKHSDIVNVTTSVTLDINEITSVLVTHTITKGLDIKDDIIITLSYDNLP